MLKFDINFNMYLGENRLYINSISFYSEDDNCVPTRQVRNSFATFSRRRAEFLLFHIAFGPSCEKENLGKASQEKDSIRDADCAGGRRSDWCQEAAVRHMGQRRERGLQDGFYGRVRWDSSHPGGPRYSDY